MQNILLLALCLGLSILSSCEITEVNVDPGRPTKVLLKQQLPIALLQTASNQSSIAGRAAAGFVQYFSGTGCWPNYYMPPATLDLYWAEGMYAGALKDAQNIVAQAELEDQPHYRGIARILLAENYGMLASMFGEVPFSEALAGNEQLNPRYDTQKEVYEGVQKLLDLAITDLTQSIREGGPAEDDLIFGGDASAWIATAYALKVRYAMHLSRRDPKAATKALQWLENGAFSSLETQADFQWDQSQRAPNPLAEYAIDRPYTMVIDEAFHDLMENRNDPRIDFYMRYDGNEWMYFMANEPLRWSDPNAEIPLISYAELMFLKAEALLYTAATDVEIEQAMQIAIRANMTDVGVPGTEIDMYLGQWGQFPMGLDEDGKLAYILNEAYFAYYGMAFQQVWTNFRRTGLPALQAQSGSYSSYNPSGIIPRRFLYPESEQTTNLTNWKEASMRQGGALLDADTWAFADF
ncbi:MAG: SusD/RagB family nutrient-binding outer membrane lipoprotein [Bacteroidia bacterium]